LGHTQSAIVIRQKVFPLIDVDGSQDWFPIRLKARAIYVTVISI